MAHSTKDKILHSNEKSRRSKSYIDTKEETTKPKRNTAKEKGMAHSIEMISTDNQTLLLSQIEKDEEKQELYRHKRRNNQTNEIEEGRKVDPSGSQTKKSVNEIFSEEFKDLDNSSIESCSIFKVNTWLRESNSNAYVPKMVSIGPYHKKKSQLDPMKKYKLLYLRRFLKRKEGLDVESCISELEKLKEFAINCYGDIEDDSKFCQMLLLDGCFVIEFIREYNGMYPQGEGKIINDNIEGYVFLDLLLIENQLPFFVLDKLHGMTKPNYEAPLAILVGISLPLFVDLPSETRRTIIETYEDIKHLLHLVHILSCHGNRKEKSDNSTWDMFMPNATELSEVGISFVKEDKLGVETSLFDSIKFENGLMTIPHFSVKDGTETFLRNLIAYEQQSVGLQPKCFSDFATFMDKLIDTDKDVNLLRQKGIIESWIGEDKEVANLFNKIGNGVITYFDFYYKEEFTKATEHYKNPRNKIKVNFLQYYFSSPWVTISTFAALILLILTAIQTILAFIK